MTCHGLPGSPVGAEPDAQMLVERRHFEYIASASNDVVRDWDIYTGRACYSEGFISRYGYGESSAAGHIDFWYKHIHPADLENIRAETHRVINETANDKWQLQYQFQLHNGEYIHLLEKAYIIRNDEMRAIRVIAVLQDHTEVSKIKADLLNLNNELEKRTKELALLNSEFERFAYVASHDLQEPLRMISSFLELVKRNYGKSLDATAEKYIDFAVDGAVRMKALILALLEYSRIGTRDFFTQVVNIEDVVRQVEQIHVAAMEENRITIKRKTLPSLVANREQMVQLFQHLIENAIKYRRPDRDLLIEVDSELIDGTYLFSVSDNGIGIDMRFSETIFLVFQRLHRSEDYPGTGIGLAICSKIVNRHQGRIWVESEPGRGSTFYFTLAAA